MSCKGYSLFVCHDIHVLCGEGGGGAAGTVDLTFMRNYDIIIIQTGIKMLSFQR